MNKQLQTWHFIHDQLVISKPVILLYVVESMGSSPGRQGFFMGVGKDGLMTGSIGGGIMEHKFVELARELLSQDENCLMLRKQYHHKNAPKDQSGMICSGEQTNFIYRMRTEDTATVIRLVDSLKANTNGELLISPSGLSFTDNIEALTDFSFSYFSDTDWTYRETTGFKNCLHIIGGGHCALALSQLMALSGFYVKVYDDRKNLHTLSLNSYADSVVELDDYALLAGEIPEGPQNNYVVVMTFGYRSDIVAMRALMTKNLNYLGLLGSENKVKEMMAGFRAEGISEDLLKRIHAPAGIRIRSREPEEIAISIAAEIIEVKNRRLK